MTVRLGTATEIMFRMMLRCAGLLIPRGRRTDWLQEWLSELWYVRRAGSLETPLEREQRIALFCLGAFRDAWCIRHEPQSVAKRRVRASRSAVQCTIALALAAACCMSAALLLSNVRSVVRPSPYKDSRYLMMISPAGVANHEAPLIRMKQFRLWQTRSQHLFSEFGFYQPLIKPIRIGSRYTPELSVARASANLFAMLGLRPYGAIESDHTLPTLFVSEDTWQRDFHGDSGLLGSVVQVGLRRAKLGGVVSKDRWRLPGRFDAWLLETGYEVPVIADDARGFVVGHLLPSLANRHLGERWQMSAPVPGGDMGGYECVAISVMERAPFNIYLFTVFLALLSLPATTSLPLGEYPVLGEQVSWTIRLRRWMFLGIKFSLLLPTIYFGSLDLAHGLTADPLTSQYIQIITSFLMGLFGFRWALRDQRRRCPVCLCTLTNPARVGEPSRNFLAWNGTELICAGGHGLLHVPELPTSWFATQRWLYLDSSWNGVFLGTV